MSMTQTQSQTQSQTQQNVFLNTVGQMNRSMYESLDVREPKKAPENDHTQAQARDRFGADLLLNQGVRASTQSAESSKLIMSLREEIKHLKSKMEFVIEKDQEIYRLECETKLMREELATVKMTTVTDESLVRDNERLKQELFELREECACHREKVERLQGKVLEWHRSQRLDRSSERPSGYTLELAELQRRFSALNPDRVHAVLLSAIMEFRVVDKQWVSYETMNAILAHMVLGCKATPQNV